MLESPSTIVIPNFLDFGEHLLIKLDKTSLILKNNPTSKLIFF